MEYAIKAEEIVLDIYEETVEDALKRIKEFLCKKGFKSLELKNPKSIRTTNLLPLCDKVLQIGYYDKNRCGFYIFIFKNALLVGKADIYFKRPSSHIHAIIVSMDREDNRDCIAGLKKWGRLGFLLRKKKDFLKTMLSLKTEKEIANYINLGFLKKPKNI